MVLDVQSSRIWRDVTTPGFYVPSQLVAGAATSTRSIVAASSRTIITSASNIGGGFYMPADSQLVSINAKVSSGSTSGTSGVYVNVRKGSSYFLPGNIAPIFLSFSMVGSTSYVKNYSPFASVGDEYFFVDLGTSGRTARGLTITFTYYQG